MLPAPPAIAADITVDVVLAGEGGRLTFERADNAILSDPEGLDGYRDVWRFTLDGSGKIASRACLTCGNPDMPYHNGNPRYDPFGRGFMFQVENKNCDAASLGNKGSPGSGACNDWWWWAAGNEQFYQLTTPPVGYAGVYAQMHGKWSKNADYFVYSYRLSEKCTDTYGCNFGGSWELQAAEVTWTNPQPNVWVPQFGTIHHYSPGQWPGHFYQMTGTSPADNGVILFESNSLVEVTSLGDIDVATMRLRDAAGNWLSNDQASASVKVLSEFSTDGSHTAEWNELAGFTPDGTEIQWMSSYNYPVATSLANLCSDYWRCKPDGTSKYQLSHFNAQGSPEYTGQRTIASNYVFQNNNEFFAYVYRQSAAPDNIARIQVPVTAPIVVTQAATFLAAPGVAPGSLASAFVSGLSGFSASVAGSLPWPANLAGVEVKVNDVPAPLYYVGPAAAGGRGQINFQVPGNTQSGVARITVSLAGAMAAQGTMVVVPVAPGIFLTDAASLQGAVQNSDYRTNGAAVLAKRGDVVQIYGTGAGQTQSPVLDGIAPPAGSDTLYIPAVYFGYARAVVAYSGLTNYPGLWQINAYVPDQPQLSGLVPVYVVQNGVASNVASVWVAP